MVCHAVFFKYCAGKMCQAKVVNMLFTHSILEFTPSATEYIFSHSSAFNVDIKATHLSCVQTDATTLNIVGQQLGVVASVCTQLKV